MKENHVSRKEFNTFYTVKKEDGLEIEDVKFSRVNKFAGKSSYLAYTPAYTNDERIMEAAWNEF